MCTHRISTAVRLRPRIVVWVLTARRRSAALLLHFGSALSPGRVASHQALSELVVELCQVRRGPPSQCLLALTDFERRKNPTPHSFPYVPGDLSRNARTPLTMAMTLSTSSNRLMFTGIGLIPPASAANYVPWAILGFLSQYLVRRRYFPFWAKYNCTSPPFPPPHLQRGPL